MLALGEAGFKASFVLPIYATNCLEALLAAWVIHRWSDAPARLDTLHLVTVFVIVSVLFAPIVSTFSDAAILQLTRGEDYWQVCVRRLFSNTLSQLTLVPALLLVLGRGASWLRTASPRRLAEAALIGFGLVFVGLQVFTGTVRESPFVPGGAYTVLPLLLPLMILAAARFGPGGASLTLLATALIAIGTALAGFTPLRAVPVGERVLALQVFLIVVGVPLLVLSALTEERRVIAETLHERLRFEEFLSQLSGAFVHTPGDEITRALETWLERAGRFLGVNRVALWQLSPDEEAIEMVARWSNPPSSVVPLELRRADFPWADRHMLAAAQAEGRHGYPRLVVFGSLSKRSNAPGLRSGYAAGDRALIAAFLRYRTYHGSAMSGAVTAASIAAWQDETHVVDNRAAYRAKFTQLAPLLATALPCAMPQGAFYLWARTPGDDAAFAKRLLAEENVAVLPGSYLARDVQGVNPGAGRVRIALVPPLADCAEALERIVACARRG